MISTTTIVTTEASRICKRLVNHWKHKYEIEEHGLTQHILMQDARVSLTSTPDALNVALDTTREDQDLLKQVIIDHLNRMAQQQFEVEWQQQ